MNGSRGDAIRHQLAMVASALPGGGEERPGQAEMSAAVAEGIARGRHLVVQAGTGTGKSLAYLLPLAQSRTKAVVATATKALQDQLAEKDLPFLASQLAPETELTFSVLKGRSNYLCRQRAAELAGTAEDALESSSQGAMSFDEAYDEARQASGKFTTDRASASDAGDRGSTTSARSAQRSTTRLGDQLRAILEWADRSESGDRADLDFEPHPRAWAAVSVGPRECPGAFRCPSGAVCFAERARALAAASDIVVVNTHLYATHLASGGSVLPAHDVLVLDEAHAVEDTMTAGLGLELSVGRLRAVAATARGALSSEEAGLSDSVIDAAERLDIVLSGLAGRRVLRGARSASASSGPGERGADQLVGALALLRGRLEALSGAVRRADNQGGDGDKLTRSLLAVGHLLEDLRRIEASDEDDVAWVEPGDSTTRSVTLKLAPIEVGPLLAERLWPGVTAVLTSATVPPMLENRLGLPAGQTDRLDVGSPFPFSEQALLYCPTDLPDRRRPEAEAAVHDELERMINAAGGRTLALFTSWHSMRAAVQALRPRLEFSVLAQNDQPKQKLLQEFRDDESTCLFATMSFWQGVDVPGTTLSVVAIDRLPFPRPDDPLLQARRDRAGRDAFRVVDLPRAATLLAQGVGRLIRSSSDCGLVAVLDRRLAASSYGESLRDVLPPMRFTTRRDEAIEFLASVRSPLPTQ